MGAPEPPAPSPKAPLEERTPEDGRPGIRVPEIQETKLKPFNGFATGRIFRHGPLGFMDLSLGAAANEGPIFNNLALNGGVRFTPWLRAHLTAVARNGNWSPQPSSLIQEGYLEASGRTRFFHDPLQGGLRFGRVQTTAMDDLGPLAIFDQLPLWPGNRTALVPAYQQLVPFLDWQSRYAFGFHTSASYDVFNSPTAFTSGGFNAINGYMRLRAQNEAGYLMELRGGWLTSRQLVSVNAFPGKPEAGTELYLGKQWKSGVGAGVAVEQTLGSPFRIGAAVNVGTNAVSQAFGNFLGRVRTSGPSFSAQVPIARLNLGEQRVAPPPGGQLVGVVHVQRIYRTTSGVGVSQYPINDEYEISREGRTAGSGLVRVVTEGPRSLNGFAGFAAPSGPGSRYNTQYTQDVVYSYYKVVPFSDTWLEGRVYDRENPGRKISDLALRLKAKSGDETVQAPDGEFKVQRKLPPGNRQSFTLVASAPGYMEETVETRLAPGGKQVVEIPLRRCDPACSGGS